MKIYGYSSLFVKEHFDIQASSYRPDARRGAKGQEAAGAEWMVSTPACYFLKSEAPARERSGAPAFSRSCSQRKLEIFP
jgi:hypothetical protein